MPGVGARNRVRPSVPGKLLVRESDGTIRALVDGANPTAQSFNLVDVNAPAVSYDGNTVVFSGLPNGDYSAVEYGAGNGTLAVGAWRIFVIQRDGTGLRQVTQDDAEHVEATFVTRFGPQAGRSLLPYDDFDPVFLPDGRICFSSTRFPAYAHYSGQRTSQLHVINADGTGLRRITSERNSADRPLVDPLTGQVVYARWWRNLRFPTNVMDTVPSDLANIPADLGDTTGMEAYEFHHGIKRERYPTAREGTDAVFEGDSMFRNAWHTAHINPDGTGLGMFSGFLRSEPDNHSYGGAFTDDGVLFANSFPMINMTEASGFGGIRRVTRGPGRPQGILGVTTTRTDFVSLDPRGNGIPSYGIYQDRYAGEPAVLPNPNDNNRFTGPLVVSMTSTTADLTQDYGLYLVEQDGSNPRLLYDLPGTAELRAAVLAPRRVPPIIPDRITTPPMALPPVRVPTTPSPQEKATVAQDGTFTFHVLNVYANAPVDVDIVSAPPIGSAAFLRGFADYQRNNPGSFETMDWPILMEVVPVSASGEAILHPPAHLPLFEDLRGADQRVPGTGGHYGALGRNSGAAFVAGMNFGRAGEVVRCVGCHTGHSMQPANHAQEAAWTNLAPGARVTLSSVDREDLRLGMEASLNDRLVQKTPDLFYAWRTAEASGQTGQWAALTFPVPVWTRTVVLYNQIPQTGGNITDIVVTGATIKLYADEAATQLLGTATSGALAVTGTAVDVSLIAQPNGVRVVRVELDGAQGRVYGRTVMSLAEIEVEARGDAP